MNKVTTQKADVNSYFEGHWQDFYSTFLSDIQKAGGQEFKAVCCFHQEEDPSLSINNETGLFQCFGCKKSGDAFKFYGLLKGVSGFPEILQSIGEDFNIQGSGSSAGKSSGFSKKEQGRIVATYDYTDEKGELLFQVVRFAPKGFRQRRPDGQWSVKGVRMVLYRLPEVLQAELVLMPEGEKDVNNLRKLGFTATTSPGGAEKWLESYGETLSGRDVILLPDSDEAGFKHVQKVASSLKDVARSVKVLELPGLADKGDVSDWIQAGGTKEELEKMIAECPPWEPEEDPSETAKKLFPRGPFPWEVLPSSISDSLQQLARSCASSPTSLPGAAVSIFSSVIGSTVSVSPKQSWSEPLIFWHSDIRPSGSGKTPAARSLCRVLYEAQSTADEEYKLQLEEWQALSKKDRGQPPDRPRGYFITDLTIEGLRTDHSGHGGSVCILDELSAFLSAQNQYKAKKGSDRESWLALHDGKPARIVRAGKSLTLSGSRISIFGGVQPGVWRKSFSSDEGEIYLIDGTIFRFLPTFEGEAFYPLTVESWSDENREAWEGLLRTAMRWSDSQQKAKQRKVLCLDQDAQQAFLDWRNELVQIKEDLPGQVRGFIPKLVGYALRFAGVFYLMDVFSRGEEPVPILNEPDIQKGIKISEFYLGHIIQAMDALISEDAKEVFEVTDQVIHLAKTLEVMKRDLDNGMLAVGFIQERFNEKCEKGLRIRSPHRMGSMLRKCDLTISAGRFHCNGKHGVRCLKWDKKTDMFIESCPQSPQNPQTKGNQQVTSEDIEKKKSSQVLKGSSQGEGVRTLRTSEKGSPQREVIENTENEDIEDNFSSVKEKEEAPEFVEI